MRRLLPVYAALALFAAPLAAPRAQQPTDARAAVLAVTDSVLAAINRNDSQAIAAHMLPEAFTMSIRDSTRYTARTREQVRTRPSTGTIVERGFKPTVHVSGPLAVVWLPYDIYVNGAWSHCGIDAFTLVKSAGAWKMASMAWTVEQPPACERHPDGPPRGG